MKKLLLLIIISIHSVMADTRIKDIAVIEGMRENQLIGYSLAIGLRGTGDNLRNAVFTQKGIKDLLERLGVNLEGSDIKTKNIAAVVVTANLPGFARQGTKMDVRVSTIGDATSLRGGTLLATPLFGADGQVYAVAQGSIIVPEFSPASDDVRTRSASVETAALVQNGAIVEREVDFKISNLHTIKFSLYSPDFTTSTMIADAINNNIMGNTATALDASTIEVTIPAYNKKNIVGFISKIEQLPIKPDFGAKVVINESTGTVVFGSHVTISQAAIAHGNIIINVGKRDFDDYNPLIPAEKRDLINKAIDIRRGKAMRRVENGATLGELVKGLNSLGVYPRDIIDILRNMYHAGVLHATIETR